MLVFSWGNTVDGSEIRRDSPVDKGRFGSVSQYLQGFRTIPSQVGFRRISEPSMTTPSPRVACPPLFHLTHRVVTRKDLPF